MRQVISLHVGGGGIRVGNACWQLFGLQHGINIDGHLECSSNLIKNQISQNNKSQYDFQSFYEQQYSPSGEPKFTPRCLHLDLQSDQINKIKNGAMKNLFRTQEMAGKVITGGVYAKGHSSLNGHLVQHSLDSIRKIVEKCDQLQGFLINHSAGGGTGSGFTSLIIEKLQESYDKTSKFGLTNFPQLQSPTESVVQPYNTILSTSKLLTHVDMDLPFSNTALKKLSASFGSGESQNTNNSSFRYENKIISRYIESLTQGIRFNGDNQNNLIQMQSQLIPYARFKFLFGSLSAMQCKKQVSVVEQTFNLFCEDNILSKCSPKLGKYMAMTIMYRGSIIPKDVSAAFSCIKTKQYIKFADWCSTGIKFSINYQPIHEIGGNMLNQMASRSVCMIANNTAIHQEYDDHLVSFKKMLKKKAYMHWYIQEGMEEIQFVDAAQNIQQLGLDYNEAQLQSEGVEESI